MALGMVLASCKTFGDCSVEVLERKLEVGRKEFPRDSQRGLQGFGMASDSV